MAGETVKVSATCLAVRPWSRTSHVVTWLSDRGKVTTLVKGAVRPKSVFLGQYDLNYTCEIVYYARSRGDLHALRECAPLDGRDRLREDYRALVMAEHFRKLVSELAPAGPEAAAWRARLETALDRLAEGAADAAARLGQLLDFELGVLDLAGLLPDFAEEDGQLALRGERSIPVSAAVVRCLRRPLAERNLKILLDAARVIGVFYTIHLDCAPEARRAVLRLICNNEEG